MSDSKKNQLLKDMRLSMWDAFFFALMVGSGEGYLVAFALEVGLDPVYAGLLGTIPLFVGGVVQLFVSSWLNKIGDYHRFVYRISALQAISFLPFVICAYYRFGNFPLFLFLNSLYWIFAFSAGPAWNAMMSGLIPLEERKNFFSKRIRFTYSGMFIGVVLSGVLLEFARKSGHVIDYFGIVFIFCMVVRMISSFFLMNQSKTSPKEMASPESTFSQMFKFKSSDGISKTIRFVVNFKVGIYISAPFFVPYMLKELKMSYYSFVVIICSSIMGKILISKNLSKISEKISLNKLLFLCSLGISFIPLLWLLSKKVGFLFMVEIFSGTVWGGFEYSFLLLVFNEIQRKDQVRYMSVFNFYNAVAIIIGSILGGFVFTRWTLSGSAYVLIFVLSSTTRLLSLVTFPQFFQTLPHIRKQLILRPMSIRPNQGTIDRPVILSKD